MAKKILMLICFFLCLVITKSQEECLSFSLKYQGAKLVSSGFDSNGKKVSTIIYSLPSLKQGAVTYHVQNEKLKLVCKGQFTPTCEDGELNSRFINMQSIPVLIKKLKDNVKLESCLLNYPNAYSDFLKIKPNSRLKDGEIVVQSEKGIKEILKLRISDRQYVRKEERTTKAGDFQTTNISYYVDVIENGVVSETLWVLEWYAQSVGIVRSETYNKLKELIGYTELVAIEE